MRFSPLLLLPLLLITGGCRDKDAVADESPRTPAKTHRPFAEGGGDSQESAAGSPAPASIHPHADPALLARVARLFNSMGEAHQTTMDQLGIGPDRSEPVMTAIRTCSEGARKMQAELFGDRKMQLDQHEIIPGVPEAQLAGLIASFRKSLPAGLDETQTDVLCEVMDDQIRREFGSDIPVTLVKSKFVTTWDMRTPPSGLPGLKFLIQLPNPDGSVQPTYYSAVPLQGSRFDFLKAADGLDGRLHMPDEQ